MLKLLKKKDAWLFCLSIAVLAVIAWHSAEGALINGGGGGSSVSESDFEFSRYEYKCNTPSQEKDRCGTKIDRKEIVTFGPREVPFLGELPPPSSPPEKINVGNKEYELEGKTGQGYPIYAYTEKGAESCESWQKCEGDDWEEEPNCVCKGECLEAPIDPRYYNDPTIDYPALSSPGSPNNIFLPVKFAWKNVAGWMEEDGPQSYKIEIDNTNFSALHGSAFLGFGAEISGELAPGIIEGEFNWPTTCKHVSSPYGSRPPDWHAGIDISGCSNRMISASATGTVEDLCKGLCTGWGNSVLIKHTIKGKIFYTVYAHLEAIRDDLQKGSIVSTGTPIGIMGTTGNSTGIHLHFEIRSEKPYEIQAVRYSPLSGVNENADCGTLLGINRHTRFACAFNPRPWLDEGGGGISDENYDSLYDEFGIPLIESGSFGFPYNENGELFNAILSRNSFPATSCLLKSGEKHNWNVQACCGFDGLECGPKSNWGSISTNPAPEPLAPYDIDWSGEGYATVFDVGKADLRWCETRIPKIFYPNEKEPPAYYKIYVSIQEEGKPPKCHPDLQSGFFGLICSPIRVDPDGPFEPYARRELLNSQYGFFTRIYRDNNISYLWRVAACSTGDLFEKYCTPLSQEWKFAIDDTLKPPSLINPSNQERDVPFPVTLKWTTSLGANSFIYEIYEGSSRIHSGKAGMNLSDPFNYPDLKLDTEYRWRVKSCWDHDSKKCEDEWSDMFSFTTTGRPPNLYDPKGEDVLVPVNFQWEKVRGAQSYVLEIDSGTKHAVVGDNFSIISYPEINQEESYQWRVKTCIDIESEICGNWSSPQSFKTGLLPPPENPNPEDSGETYGDQRTFQASWDYPIDQVYFSYTLSYDSVDTLEVRGECSPGKIDEGIIPSKSTFFSLDCLGNYSWQVTACLDEKCEVRGIPSDLWTFSYVEKGEASPAGLVPCGRSHNNPNTPWNERDPCQFKHLFVMLKVIIDFLLWNLMPLILVVMMIISVILFYTSIGNPEVLVKVKEIWKSVGKGLLILFLGWTFISILTGVLGYRFGIYGQWWEITF